MKTRLVTVWLTALALWTPMSVAQTAPPDTLPNELSDAPTAQVSREERDRTCYVKGHTEDPYSEDFGGGGKVRCFERRSLSIGAFIAPLFMAGPEFAKPPAGYPKEWRKGPAGFGRLYGDALAFQTVQETTRLFTGLALHEDLRYSPTASRNPLRRAIHAVRFAAFDRSDSGRTTFAASNFLSSAASGFVGMAYLPRGYNDTSHAVTRMGLQFGGIVVTNLISEFRPELRQFRKTLHLPDHLGGCCSAK